MYRIQLYLTWHVIYIHLVAQGKKELLNGYWAWDLIANLEFSIIRLTAIWTCHRWSSIPTALAPSTASRSQPAGRAVAVVDFDGSPPVAGQRLLGCRWGIRNSLCGSHIGICWTSSRKFVQDMDCSTDGVLTPFCNYCLKLEPARMCRHLVEQSNKLGETLKAKAFLVLLVAFGRILKGAQHSFVPYCFHSRVTFELACRFIDLRYSWIRTH